MTRFNIVTVALVALVLLLLAGCLHDEDDDGFACPLVSDDVTFSSYGRYVFEKSGRDSAARNIVDKCGWSADSRHNGGVGNTLQIESQLGEVTFVWAFNKFFGFVLTTGINGTSKWTGKMPGGIRLGDHITSLYSVHPLFQTNDGRIHTLEAEFSQGSRVMVHSDVNGFIAWIYVGSYYRN